MSGKQTDLKMENGLKWKDGRQAEKLVKNGRIAERLRGNVTY